MALVVVTVGGSGCVGIGVRDGIRVAVKRGVMLIIGASVSVGGGGTVMITVGTPLASGSLTRQADSAAVTAVNASMYITGRKVTPKRLNEAGIGRTTSIKVRM